MLLVDISFLVLEIGEALNKYGRKVFKVFNRRWMHYCVIFCLSCQYELLT